MISIHAPRVGCDRLWMRRVRRACKFQSTHPVWGATLMDQVRRLPDQFQSTHPVWGATFCLLHVVQNYKHFNPRTPCGVRHGLGQTALSRRFDFNPRTPCGVRLDPGPRGLKYRQFQSTHPVWGATRSGHRLIERCSISIHAPRVGCDRCHSWNWPVWSDFNPRTPCGVRPRAAVSVPGPLHFNPRTPCGVRPTITKTLS